MRGVCVRDNMAICWISVGSRHLFFALFNVQLLKSLFQLSIFPFQFLMLLFQLLVFPFQLLIRLSSGGMVLPIVLADAICTAFGGGGLIDGCAASRLDAIRCSSFNLQFVSLVERFPVDIEVLFDKGFGFFVNHPATTLVFNCWEPRCRWFRLRDAGDGTLPVRLGCARWCCCRQTCGRLWLRRDGPVLCSSK